MSTAILLLTVKLKELVSVTAVNVFILLRTQQLCLRVAEARERKWNYGNNEGDVEGNNYNYLTHLFVPGLKGKFKLKTL